MGDGLVQAVPGWARGGRATCKADLQPENERPALVERLNQYRAIAATALVGVPWRQASARLLPATDMTIAGIVKHLAWAEDRWFQGRLLGSEMPAPWDRPGADDPDHSMRLAPADTVDGILELYASTCERSRNAVARCASGGGPAHRSRATCARVRGGSRRTPPPGLPRPAAGFRSRG